MNSLCANGKGSALDFISMRRGGRSLSVFNVGKQKQIFQADDGYLQWIVSEFPESDTWWKVADRGETNQPSAKITVGDLLSELKYCTKKRDLLKGRSLHTNAVKAGMDSDIYITVALINLYSKCGSIEDARAVFDSIQEPNVVCWNVLILGYTDNGHGTAALELFSRMKSEGKCVPNSVTYVAALKACTFLATDGVEACKRECLERGRQIHSEIGRHMNHFAQSILINLYAKCGSMEDARTVFYSTPEPNVVCWNVLMLGYTDNGQGAVALELFSRMKEEGRCAPGSITYVAALKACTLLAADGGEAGKRECLERGRQIHSEIGPHLDRIAQNTLINLYAKCSSMKDARTVFESVQDPDVVSWTAIIQGYAENGEGSVALGLFSRMKDNRCAPNYVTYVAALKACMLLAADGGEAQKRECLERGRKLHSEIGCHMNNSVQSTLITFYGKCGSMEDARIVFDSIQEPDLVSWTAIILGYAENGEGSVALDLFSRMKDNGRCAPDSVTYLAALKACCLVGALAIGQKIHSVIREFDSRLVTCLVDFYAKCGNMQDAREVFDLHPQLREVSTWTALLAGYAQFGDTDSVFSLFEAMQDQGCQPDAVTFVCMLSCCSHAGLVEKAWEYLEVMQTRYGVTPTVMHYNCMIDLLGRANKLHEAVDLLKRIPCDPNSVTWTALLGAACKWKNAEIGRWAFKSLMNLDRKNASAYVLMAEIYGSRDMWEEQETVLEAGMKFGACKLPGQAYVMDGQGRLAKFVVVDEDQDKNKQVLKSMNELQGYVAEHHSISQSDVKEKSLCGHSERRAVFYGILNTSPGEVIRVVKNMRICNDCHSTTKLISKISGRVIMIRDESRFHVMENGNCSCRDYF